MADGSRHAILLTPENNYGVTPSNPPLEIIRNTGTTLGISRDSFISEELRSDRQISDFRLGVNDNQGDINFELSYESFEQMLEAVLLSDDDFPSGTADEIRSGVTRRSFTLLRNFSDITDFPYHIYRGVEITTLSLTIPASGVINGTFGAIAQTLTLAADLSALGVPTYPPESTTDVMDSFTGVVTVGGSNQGVVTEMSLTLDNGFNPRNVVGSRNIIRPSVGRSNISGSIQVYFENSTLFNNFINEDVSSLQIDLTDPVGNSYTIEIPRLKFSSGKADVSDMGPVMLPMSFQGYLDPTEDNNLIISKVDA